MSINGKRDLFTKEDLSALAKIAGIKTNRAYKMLGYVTSTVNTWPVVAKKAWAVEERTLQIKSSQRLSLMG